MDRVENARNCLRLYQAKYNQATARGDALAAFYGERVTMWVQRLESLGELTDERYTIARMHGGRVVA